MVVTRRRPIISIGRVVAWLRASAPVRSPTMKPNGMQLVWHCPVSTSSGNTGHEQKSTIQRTFKTLGIVLLTCIAAGSTCHGADADWLTVGGDKGNLRYSNLSQINRANVSQLQTAWTYHTGDAGKETTIECTPVVANRVMFVTT